VTSLFSKPLPHQVTSALRPRNFALVEIDEPLESGFERRVLVRQFALDQLVGLFEPQRIHRSDADLDLSFSCRCSQTPEGDFGQPPDAQFVAAERGWS
jgi:hypothetical protein